MFLQQRGVGGIPCPGRILCSPIPKGVLSMRKVVLCVVLGVLFIIPALSPGSEAAEPAMTLRFAGQFPEGHRATTLMRQVADEVLAKTDGRIAIRVYPDNELGDYTLIYEELIRGSVDMAAISVPGHFDPRLEIASMHCIARTFDDARRFFAPGGWLFKKMNELHARLGVKLLAFQMEGFIGIGSTKPVNEPLNPEVPKGVLLRIPNMEAFRVGVGAMGYNQTVTIRWDEVLPSLQNGFAEAVSGMTPSAAQAMLKDVLKYWYDLRYSMESLNYMISLKTWEKLSGEDRAVLADACSKITDMSIDLAEKDQLESLDGLRQAGVEVHTYTGEELAPIFSKVTATWDRLADRYTPELIAGVMEEYAGK